jgi:enoyl-CoA hydratase/carnithine racemase
MEAKTQNTLTGSEDNIEGVTAFMEKRQPNFK